MSKTDAVIHFTVSMKRMTEAFNIAGVQMQIFHVSVTGDRKRRHGLKKHVRDLKRAQAKREVAKYRSRR